MEMESRMSSGEIQGPICSSSLRAAQTIPRQNCGAKPRASDIASSNTKARFLDANGSSRTSTPTTLTPILGAKHSLQPIPPNRQIHQINNHNQPPQWHN